MIKLSDYELNDFVNKVYELSKSGERVLVEMYGYKMYIMPDLSKDLVRITIMSKLRHIKNRESNLQKIKRMDVLSEEVYFELEKYSPDLLAEYLRNVTQFEGKHHSTK